MKTKGSHIIMTTFFILIFGILPFNVQANDCTDYGHYEGKWFVVEGEGIDSGDMIHPHPWWLGPEPCTKDVYNVQCAVMNHPKVKLRGDFNFGEITVAPDNSFDNLETGAVSVHETVEIVGDDAIIYYGRHVFIVLGYPGLGGNTNPNGMQDVTIRNIKFVNPKESVFGIHGDCNSFNIDNVVIEGMSTIPHPEWGVGPWGAYSWKHAISSHGEYMFPWGLFRVFKIGTISITNSRIDLGPNNGLGSQHGRAIYLWGIGTPEEPTNIVIRNNEILNTSSIAIISAAWAGSSIIKDNRIITGSIAAPWPWFTPIGISTSQAPDFSWYDPDGDRVSGPYLEGWAKLEIEGNEIECGLDGSDLISPLGIWINHMSGAVIKKNKVQVHSGLSHVLVEWGVNEGLKIEKNDLSGSGMVQYAIGLTRAINSSIKKNDLSKIEAYETQLKMEEGVNDNSVQHNDFGSGGSLGGIYCNGSYNKFVNNSFHGNFQGWDGSSGFGFMYLGNLSSDNHVVALKNGTPPHGGDDFNICDQVLDEGINNRIQGYDECY